MSRPKQPIVSIAFRKHIRQKQPAAPILAADIGGTKTNIALYRLDENGLHQLSSEKRYLSKDYHSLTDIIHDFTGGEETPTSFRPGGRRAVRRERKKNNPPPRAEDHEEGP